MKNLKKEKKDLLCHSLAFPEHPKDSASCLETPARLRSLLLRHQQGTGVSLDAHRWRGWRGIVEFCEFSEVTPAQEDIYFW